MVPTTVLLVDDHVEFLSIRAEWLERLGYRVVSASSSTDARRALKEQTIDVAVLDLRLENSADPDDRSGLDLAREIASNRPTPTIIMTAYPDVDTAIASLEPDYRGLSAAVRFVPKDKGVDAMVKAIEQALALRPRVFQPDFSLFRNAKAWALLVGIDDYHPDIPRLAVCTRDATAICQTLNQDYYHVRRLLTDDTVDNPPTRNNIFAELRNLAASAQPDDVLLFYFSGHGVAEGKKSYLLASDTRVTAIFHTAIDVKQVFAEMTSSSARGKIIILDACHSGADLGKAAPGLNSNFIKHFFRQAEGIVVLASCSQGQRSYVWPEATRSVFTHFLLQALSGQADQDQKGFVTVSDVVRHTAVPVKIWAVERGLLQVPTCESKVAGDIIANYCP